MECTDRGVDGSSALGVGPCAAGLYTRGGIDGGVLHAVKKKRGGETIVPVWALGLWKRVGERRSGPKEGRETELKNKNGNGRSEV